MSVNCATAFIAILAATALRFILVRLNKKLDRGEHVEGSVPGPWLPLLGLRICKRT